MADSDNIYSTWYRRYDASAKKWDRIAFKTLASGVLVNTVGDAKWSDEDIADMTDANSLLYSAYSWAKKFNTNFGSGTIITTDNLGNQTIDGQKVSITLQSAASQIVTTGSDNAEDLINDIITAFHDEDSALSGRINGKQDTLTITGVTDESAENKKKIYSAAKVDAQISTAKTEVMNVASGKTKTYVIKTSNTLNKWFNVNKDDDSTGDEVNIVDDVSVTDINGDLFSLSELKVGDIILTATKNISDWFYGGRNKDVDGGDQYYNAYRFFKIEADIPDMDDYVKTSVKVNGHALTSDVAVSASDVGLGSVANTGDSATPVSGGTTKFTTGGAYTLKTDLISKINAKQAFSQNLSDFANDFDSLAHTSSGTLQVEYNADKNSGHGGWDFSVKTHHQLYVQSAEPTSGLNTNDIWIAI